MLVQTQSGAAEYRLDWLNYFLGLMVVVSVIDFTRHLLGFTGQSTVAGYFYALVLIFILVSVTFLLIKALKQPDIFVGIKHGDEGLPDIVDEFESNCTSAY